MNIYCSVFFFFFTKHGQIWHSCSCSTSGVHVINTLLVVEDYWRSMFTMKVLSALPGARPDISIQQGSCMEQIRTISYTYGNI